jgi:hypothetical protein
MARPRISRLVAPRFSRGVAIHRSMEHLLPLDLPLRMLRQIPSRSDRHCSTLSAILVIPQEQWGSVRLASNGSLSGLGEVVDRGPCRCK